MSFTRRAFIQRMAQVGGYSAAFASMQALGLLPAAIASTLPQLPAGFGKGRKVVILGGGIAGLTSAYVVAAPLDSSSKVTATLPLADRRTLSPSISATRPTDTK